jgi:hypothetical protein
MIDMKKLVSAAIQARIGQMMLENAVDRLTDDELADALTTASERRDEGSEYVALADAIRQERGRRATPRNQPDRAAAEVEPSSIRGEPPTGSPADSGTVNGIVGTVHLFTITPTRGPSQPWGRYWLTADLPGYPVDGETDDDVTKLKASADRLFAELLAALGLAERGTRTES